MTAKDVGRNDPCPCGSGKKYKYCCLRRDQRRRRRRVSTSAPDRSSEPAGLLHQIRQLKQQLTQGLPHDESRELEKQIDRMEEAAAYAAMEDAIDAATQTLEAHRPDFKRMMADPQAAMDRAYHLFSEERFADLRFSPDDIEQAFEQVGYPAPGPQGLDDEDMRILVAAAVHLAGDEEHRLHMTRRLMMTLPDYVDAGRYLDAWLIQYSAFRLTEVPEQSNPFMFVMVQLAFEAWGQRMEREQDALMEALGVDPAMRDKLTLDEARALGERLMQDPDKRAHLERFYRDHADMGAQIEAQMRRQEDEALKLLKREDAECILLSPTELAPWVSELAERTASLQAQTREVLSSGGQPGPELVQEAQSIVLKLSAEMADAVYTSERVEQLVADLRDYGRRLEESGEQEAAQWVDSALMVTQWSLPASDNPFLAATCFASLRAVSKAAADTEARPE